MPEPVASTDDLVGVVIADRYLITEKLGAGGMGRVYLAQHVRLPKQAAIKVLHPWLLHDAAARDRFKEEAERTCRIRDSHVAQVYDFGETAEGQVYLEMEFVEGEALSALLAREGALPPARVAEIVRQVAEGLTAAHEIGIVHRDLKPDNIMVGANRDGTDCIKVVDFGIAKAIQGEPSKHTQTGMVIGTPEYMSPDQLSSLRLDARSDIYALGLVAFVMLTGQLPFGGETRQDGMWMRLSDPPRTLRATRADIDWPPSVQAVMDRALARSRDDRYATPNDFARDLVREVAAWRSLITQPRPADLREHAGEHPHLRTRPMTRRLRSASVIAAVLFAGIAVAPKTVLRDSAKRDMLARDTTQSDATPSDTMPSDTTALRVVAAGGLEDGRVRRSRRDGGRTTSVIAIHPTVVAPQIRPESTRLETGAGRARAELQRLDSLLTNPYGITLGVALAARAGIDTLLPLLRSREDSVAARYHAAELDLVLTADRDESLARKNDACRIVTSIREPARGTRFEVRVRLLLEQLGCD